MFITWDQLPLNITPRIVFQTLVDEDYFYSHVFESYIDDLSRSISDILSLWCYGLVTIRDRKR